MKKYYNKFIFFIFTIIIIIKLVNSNFQEDEPNYIDKYIENDNLGNKNKDNNEKTLFEKIKNELLKKKDDSPEDYDDENLENGRTSTLIKKTFSDGKTFNCQRVKKEFYTGYKSEKINPEDISIVAAMGDSLSTGMGLWQNLKIEFRGAVFTVGGDSYLEGLVTIPSILQLFNQNLMGESHGMGDLDHLPIHQFNVAVSGSQTDDLESQANNLVSRLYKTFSRNDLEHKWILIFITIGTEETCYHCDPPSIAHIRKSVKILRKQLPKIFVVLIGPLFVASTIKPQFNILKSRCPCLKKMSMINYEILLKKWIDSFETFERDTAMLKFKNFGLVGIPKLELISNKPEYYLLKGQPLLNRRGHSYAAKWLWNRLIAGKSYNTTFRSIEKDSYFCPPMECPYFKVMANEIECKVETIKEHEAHIEDAKKRFRDENDTFNNWHQSKHLTRTQKMIRDNIIVIVLAIIFLCFMIVLAVGRHIYINQNTRLS
ncbi:Lipase, GDSL domain and SGNH hydrolase-type esterase domain-containing protein [Strongyloides ratti]|uniref:Lipase, GDSL domain and SGNH hydrolase-type esterase domain-containing protein n=1 Tax=Strongyloides ratti TaxID=34506 RepID=A0A090LCL7_STRRB|nr:Lipase, GDSL domain and SGNH hydrolase-type esterase domain-containing protein [Strongyloides ratti]CEF65863.1 Lipase, GDSL domain and SGNH hydrolase-type esterase domain-containing protein [Strongyloides ratti]